MNNKKNYAKDIQSFPIGIGRLEGQLRSTYHYERKKMTPKTLIKRVEEGCSLSHNFKDKVNYEVSELSHSDFESTNFIFIAFKNSKYSLVELYGKLNFKPMMAFNTSGNGKTQHSYMLIYAVESPITSLREYHCTLNIFLNVILDISNRDMFKYLDNDFLNILKCTLPCMKSTRVRIDESGWYTDYFFERIIRFLEQYEGYVNSLLEKSSIPGYTCYIFNYLLFNKTINNNIIINNNNINKLNNIIKIKELICISENGISFQGLSGKVRNTVKSQWFKPLLTNIMNVNHKEESIYTNVKDLEIFTMKSAYLRDGKFSEKSRNKALALYAYTLKKLDCNINLVFFISCLYWFNEQLSVVDRMKENRVIEFAIDLYWDDLPDGNLSTKVKYLLNSKYDYLTVEEKRKALNQARNMTRVQNVEKAIDLNKSIKGANEEATGYKKSTIYQFLKDKGIRRKTKYDRFKEELNMIGVSGSKSKDIQVELAKKLEITTRSIRNYMKKYKEEIEVESNGSKFVKSA